jgi:hypothetical protein
MFKSSQKFESSRLFLVCCSFVPALFPKMSSATSLDVLEEPAQQEAGDYMNPHGMFIQQGPGDTRRQL